MFEHEMEERKQVNVKIDIFYKMLYKIYICNLFLIPNFPKHNDREVKALLLLAMVEISAVNVCI